MIKERLKEIMLDQKDSFNQKKNLIDRDIDISKYISTGQVIIISGIRRCGKSSLLYLIKERLGLSEKEYCYFNFDDERIITDVTILESIYNLHIEVYGNEPVLFFDEIQNVLGWEKFVNRIYEKGIKIYVTGSNAKLLSSEISTSLTGRNKVIELFPFSFSEYLRFIGNQYNLSQLTTREKALIQKDFNHFFNFGGFPLVLKDNDIDLVNGYFQDILYRDIVSRYRLTQVNEIKQIGLYFASNVGKLFSYATLKSISGVKSLSSIKSYLWYYEQSYLFFYLKKYDFSIKKQIMNSRKVYAIDQGIINRLGFGFSENRGRVLENIIFIELLRRGKEVYYHKGISECDFVIKEGLKVVEAIQVSFSIDENNQEREINGLRDAMNTYNLKFGLLIVNSVYEKFVKTHNDIIVIQAWEWLLT